MRKEIDIEKAWRADEIRRFDTSLRLYAIRDRRIKKLLEELDRMLPEYPRKVDWKPKPFKLLKALKNLLP